METLCGKIALVAGAAGGLGSAIAAALARRGVHVLLNDLQKGVEHLSMICAIHSMRE
jgi:NAD(P)-dependent dehydrogenase (short-subunit alcohol dehydrogenase family)